MWLGLALVVTCVVVGARLMTVDEATSTAWRATADLTPGSLPRVEPVTMALGPMADAYATGSQPPTGRLRIAVAAGTLLPAAAVEAVESTPARLVTVGVEPLSAPVGVAAGDVVDVWASPVDTAAPRLVREQVLVRDVSSDVVGAAGRLAVVLEVPPSDVAALVAALHGGVVDLVEVPWTQASAVPPSGPGVSGGAS